MSPSQLGNPTNGLLVAVGLFAYVAQYPLGGSEVLGIRPTTKQGPVPNITKCYSQAGYTPALAQRVLTSVLLPLLYQQG